MTRNKFISQNTTQKSDEIKLASNPQHSTLSLESWRPKPEIQQKALNFQHAATNDLSIEMMKAQFWKQMAGLKLKQAYENQAKFQK